ncbi:hypothetical protein BDV93DRAFT_559379 [Ceratobasidium sp. AG-I]|nr:hypothetical protein BDV93DRAFT_559379 [Ceratobasidium sp. AG-I]
MTSPLALFATSKETRRRNKAIYLEYAELAAVDNHPAIVAIAVKLFPYTRQFLQDPKNSRIWETVDIQPAVEQVALRLDRDWPDWAASRTNVFGVVLSDLFYWFFPWLEALPSKKHAINAGMRFERHLFAQAEARQSIDWWKERNTQPAPWFRISETGERMRIYAGHPVMQMKARSWRYYQQYMVAKGAMKVVPEEGWVYV